MPLSKPVLVYQKDNGLSYPANPASDSGETNFVIPMILTSYAGPQNQLTLPTITTIPITNGRTSWGGNAVGTGSRNFKRITLEGTLDTPFNTSTMNSLLTLNSMNLTYADFIVACMEGRADAGNSWAVRDPAWFRDPYDRVYTTPRVFDFNASYIEAVPYRNTFQMTLVVE